MPTVELHPDLAKLVGPFSVFDFILLCSFCVIVVRVVRKVRLLGLVGHTVLREEVLTYLCADGLVALTAFTWSVLC